MFERLKDCADRINDQRGPLKHPLAADPLTAIAPLLRVRPEIQDPHFVRGNFCSVIRGSHWKG
jgi:hypothetical protein